MKPIDFPFRNMELAPPPGMTPEECIPLPVWSDGKMFVSVWQLSDEELEKIIQTRQVYLAIYGGSHPPVSVEVESMLEKSFDFTVGDSIFCKVYIPGYTEMIEVSGVIELEEKNYVINTGKRKIPMAYAREVTIVPKSDA